MSIFGKIKKGIKKTAKKAKKAVKSGEKYLVKKEKDLGKAFDKYNKTVESKIRGKLTKGMPKGLKKGGISVGKFLSHSVHTVDHMGRNLSSKAGLKEAYDLARHFNPLGDVELTGNVLQGKTSVLEAGFDLETGYSRGLVKDYIKFQKWQGSHLRKARLHTAVSRDHKISIPENNLILPHNRPEIGGPIGVGRNRISVPNPRKTGGRNKNVVY